MDMVRLSLLFLVLLVTTTYAQIGSDGTGTVNGYSIGPGADLSGAILRIADLRGADLSGADLSGADLEYADLSYADLRYADLSRADLRRAVLWGADLSGANLSNAKVNQDEYNGVIMNYPNNFPDAIFTNVISPSDYDAVVAERDAALTAQAAAEAERDVALAAQATAEAERDAKLTLDEVKDLRAGSTMIEIDNGQATLSMEVEESDDLAIWTSGGTTNLTVPADTGTKFFRFKMAE